MGESAPDGVGTLRGDLSKSHNPAEHTSPNLKSCGSQSINLPGTGAKEVAMFSLFRRCSRHNKKVRLFGKVVNLG